MTTNMLDLKLATYDYFSDIIDMARKFHEASPYHGLEDYDESQVSDKILQFLESPGKAVIILLVHPDTNKAVGMVIGIVTEGIFNRNRVAAEIAWWVDQEHRGKQSLELFEAYLYWADHVAKCDTVSMALLEDEKIEGLSRLYKRKGFVPTERAFIRKKK